MEGFPAWTLTLKSAEYSRKGKEMLNKLNIKSTCENESSSWFYLCLGVIMGTKSVLIPWYPGSGHDARKWSMSLTLHNYLNMGERAP